MAGKVLRCETFFQGFPCVNSSYRRSAGFLPEFGYVDVHLRHLRQMRLVPRTVPWRSANGFSGEAQFDILAWSRAKSRATVTESTPDFGAPAGGGLNRFGTLVMRTLDRQGAKIDEIVYKDVYVAESGIEEITRGLSRIRDHKEGLVRIPLTDIREYSDHGSLVCRINVGLDTGALDPLTAKDGKREPWPFVEVVEFLFSQMAGNPSVNRDSDLYEGEYDAPSDIIGEGEPAREHLEKLLTRRGMIAQMQPDCSWAVNHKYSKRPKYNEISTAVKKVSSQLLPIHYERKTITIPKRPAAVMVLGKRRVKRITVSYVPVLQDTDGRWYKMADLVARWGYSMEKLNAQIFNSGYRFVDVPPTPKRSSDGGESAAADGPTTTSTDGGTISTSGGFSGPSAAGGDGDGGQRGGGGGRVHMQRVKILETAYTRYLPAFLFAPGGAAPETHGPAARDPRTEHVPFLPIQGAAWYLDELANAGIGFPKDQVRKGDQGSYVVLDPVVRAQAIGHTMFSDWDEIERQYDERVKASDAESAESDEALSFYRRLQEDIALQIKRAELVAPETVDDAKLAARGLKASGKDLVKLGDDVRIAGAEVGVTLTNGERDAATKESHSNKEAILAAKEMADAAAKAVDQRRTADAKLALKLKDIKEVFEKRMAIRAWFNVERHVRPRGSYRLDQETGLLESSELLCQMDKPVFFGGTANAVDDGHVSVTYGYELDDNGVSGYTSFIFVPQDGEDPTEPATVKCAGICRSSPLHAKTVHMNGRLYILDEGAPVNMNDCLAEAAGKAAAELAVPRVVEGYTYELIGLRKVVVDGATSSVQHFMKGKMGMTHVAVAAPNSRMPLGPANLSEVGNTVHVDVRDAIEQRQR